MLPHLTCCFEKKLQSVLNFGQNVSWKLLKIIPVDLLDTLHQEGHAGSKLLQQTLQFLNWGCWLTQLSHIMAVKWW